MFSRAFLKRTTQRAYSSNSSNATQLNRSTRLAVASTISTLGLAAWYYHIYVSPASAMTAAEHGLHPPSYPFTQKQPFLGFDHASLRRGFQVYKEVCSACHSLDGVAWRSLVGVTHTNTEARALAEEHEYDADPDDNGEPQKRPGKLADHIPPPYPNEQAARAANQGALPPDLSVIVKARENGLDYIFSILTGYPDEPPAGVTLNPGLNYNPYFANGGIAMARVLFDGVVEYDDGTPATTSQMAKDVTNFLNWAAEPELDQRKRAGIKVILVLATLFTLSVWVKRFKWIPIKNRKLVYNPPKN